MNMKRGSDRYNAALTESDVLLILEAVKERNRLRAEASQLSNRSLAEKLEVPVAAVDNVTSGRGYTRVGDLA